MSDYDNKNCATVTRPKITASFLPASPVRERFVTDASLGNSAAEKGEEDKIASYSNVRRVVIPASPKMIIQSILRVVDALDGGRVKVLFICRARYSLHEGCGANGLVEGQLCQCD
ncbi:hypothetical protein HNY73_013795 [Argiope bruennichi]|uniref:Uncharacterized protein n=1 Tax=Argiope bruennichi TaxID=94029 RepID=A0A8T0ELW8_ARGBR|nr:hypothetical protein HNY73_013795 [Argiope bruennichi]